MESSAGVPPGKTSSSHAHSSQRIIAPIRITIPDVQQEGCFSSRQKQNAFRKSKGLGQGIALAQAYLCFRHPAIFPQITG
ncbi:MAG TPA: hypothetical protein VK699_09965 [Terriglobales bacterium]|nr:hypothetical protein [Terriglobales bacterium]